MSGRYDQKKSGQQKQGQDQEQEQEVQREAPEAEHSKTQSQMGNQAIAAMVNSRADAGAAGDGEGGGRSVRRRKVNEKDGQDYGDDGDPVDDVPYSLDDLTQSWNPGTRKSEDRPRFVEAMPDDDLPPEDERWLALVAAMPSQIEGVELTTLDALVEPSINVLAHNTRGWCLALGRWTDPSPPWRVLTWMLSHGAPLLQATDGRVLPGRASTSALGTLALVAGPAARSNATVATGALIDLAMDLSGRTARAQNIMTELEQAAAQLPRAAALVDERIQPLGTSRRLRLPEADHDALVAALAGHAHWEPLESTLPLLEAPPPHQADEDDPLGLDAELEAMLGAAPDPLDGVMQTGLQTAERLASAASHTRIQWVALAVLVSEVADAWSEPVGLALHELAQRLDEQVDAVLKLLLEVARAIQKRTVPPRGLHNGLRRAARQLDGLRNSTLDVTAQIAATLLPDVAEIPAPPTLPDDPLALALSDGAPLDALEWVQALPDRVERELTTALLLASAGAAPERVRDALQPVLSDPSPRDPLLSLVATLLQAHALLHLGHAEAARGLGAALIEAAIPRQNGLLVVAGALIVVEARLQEDDPDAAARARLQAGRVCMDLEEPVALSLLARWRPPEVEDEHWAPFFDYPMEAEDDT